jgi:hypothetical protein
MSQRPFSNPYRGFTLVNNVVFDRIMPTLSPLAWKVLCVAMRETWGVPTQGDLRENQENPRLALGQFMQGSGIAKADVIDTAIQECLEAGYLLRAPAVDDPASRSEAHTFSLNTEWILDKAKGEPTPSTGATQEAAAPPPVLAETERAFQALLAFGREMGIDPDTAQLHEAVAGNDEKAVLAWIATGREMTHLEAARRFNTVVERLLQSVPPVPIELLDIDIPGDEPQVHEAPVPVPSAAQAAALWQATLDRLETGTRKSQFKWLIPTHGVDLVGETLVVMAPNKRTKEWLEAGQLTEAVNAALARVAGKTLELTFVVEEV